MPLTKEGKSLLQISILRLSFDVVDITRELIKIWSRPVPAPDLETLRLYLQKPLTENEKIPITQEEHDRLTKPSSPEASISSEELLTLYRVSPNLAARDVHLNFLTAINHVPPTSGTKALFHSTWDMNISWTLQLILWTARCFRNNKRDASGGSKRPDYGLLLQNNCVFRGEETVLGSTDNPKEELLNTLQWSYASVQYMLGSLWILLRFERVLMQMLQDITQYPPTSTMLRLRRRLQESYLSLVTISVSRQRELLIWYT